MCECAKDKKIKQLEERIEELEGTLDNEECDTEFWREKANRAEDDLKRFRQALENIANTCIECPDTAQFASRVLDGSAFVKASDKYKGERVLVFPRFLLEKDPWKLQGVSPNAGTYLDHIFDSELCQFMDRDIAENAPKYKQLIPYVVFRCGDRVFSYVRSSKSGEDRLKGNRSIGIGGHINPEDAYSESSAFKAAFLRGARREVKEEIELTGHCGWYPHVVINDDKDEVGRVHFGVVFVGELSSEDAIHVKEDALEGGEFISIKELKTTRRDELEGWSKYAIDSL
jgi:predicted NUDIX family phosphoesterase